MSAAVTDQLTDQVTDQVRGDGAARVVTPDASRAVMRHHAKGVAVITAHPDPPVGFCATSVTSLSTDPPLVSFAAGLHSSSWSAMRNSPYFLVQLLADGQEELARGFARSGGDKCAPPLAWSRGPFGLPLLDGVLAWLVLAPLTTQPVADHALVIGRVVDAGQTGGAPLVHHDGRYRRLP
ncbi:flavin reductase family protein [Streptomyces sp. NPDC018610]|uniref:flavin reductase family protein n=1 Tax=Streptomyces sp. NPDC018610 TaxID=3365049 RepID=UPI0037AA79BA